MDCFSAGAVFYSPCPAGRNLGNLINYFLWDYLLLLAALTKSWESCKLIPAGFSSGCGDFNLVDFYKVSLAARDGFYNVNYRVIIR